jgi:hypothetical protein
MKLWISASSISSVAPNISASRKFNVADAVEGLDRQGSGMEWRDE